MSQDPVPGDPDSIVILGQDLHDIAYAIQHEAGEIEALASVKEWQSKAANRFRDAAHDAIATLRKAYHRYEVASQAMGTRVTEGSTGDWASALEQAQQTAAKALRDAQAADADLKSAQSRIDRLPHGTPPTDPTFISLKKQQETATSALSKAKSELQAAQDARDTAAKTAASRIHRAITHDGMHDSTWDKVKNTTENVLGDVGHFAEEMGETALSDLASFGSALGHDPGAAAELLGGAGLTVLGAGGEVGGVVLDATGIGAILGVPANVVSAAGIATGAGLMTAGMTALGRDAAGPDRVNMSSDGGSGDSGDWGSADDDYSDAAYQGALHIQEELESGQSNHAIPGVDMNDTDAVANHLDGVMKSPGYSVQGGKSAWYDPESGMLIIRKNSYSATARQMSPTEWEAWLGKNKD